MRNPDRHDKIFTVLKEMASVIDATGRSRHASAIVYKNEVLGFGLNRRKSSPFQKRFSKHEDCIWLHSEIDAIQRVIKKYGVEVLPKCTIYVARMKYDGWEKRGMVQGMSKPCIGCSAALANFGISKVAYTCDDGGYEWL